MKKQRKHLLKRFLNLYYVKISLKILKTGIIGYLLVGSIIFMLKNQSLGTYSLVFFMVAVLANNIVGYLPKKQKPLKVYKESEDL